MNFSITANGFPLPLTCIRQGNTIHYDLDEALQAVERDLKSKTIATEGYGILLQQRDFLKELIYGNRMSVS